jgi:hypothetical protein
MIVIIAILIILAVAIIVFYPKWFTSSDTPPPKEDFLIEFNEPFRIDVYALRDILLDIREIKSIEYTLIVNVAYEGIEVPTPNIPFDDYFSTQKVKCTVKKETKIPSDNKKYNYLELTILCRGE